MRILWIASVLLLAGCAEKMYSKKFDILPEVNGAVRYIDTIQTPGISKDVLTQHAVK